MKQYITYEEALNYLDEDKYKYGDIEHELQSLIQTDNLFTILYRANLLIQIESLLSAYRIREYIKPRYKKELLEPRKAVFGQFIVDLDIKPYDDGSPGVPIIEDIVCDYILEVGELKKSLKREGVFGLLNCTCGEIDAGGLFIEVRHIGEDLISWVLALYQNDYLRKYMRGLLFDEQDYQNFLSSPKARFYWDYSEEIQQLMKRARSVYFQLPLFFFRNQLEQIIDTYS